MDESEVLRIEKEITECEGRNKLSDAILRGCALRPLQCFGTPYESCNASCVIGAAADGLGLGFVGIGLVGSIARVTGASPEVISLCLSWNDTHKWTRERIAEWIRR